MITEISPTCPSAGLYATLVIHSFDLCANIEKLAFSKEPRFDFLASHLDFA